MVMYEGSAKEITDADFNAALKFGQEAIQPVDCRAEGTGRPRRQAQAPDHAQRRPGRDPQGSQGAGGRPHRPGPAHAGQARPRRRRRSAITEEIGKKLVEKFGAEKVTEFVLKDAFYYIQKEAVRGLIMNQGKRLDGRDFETVRPIVSEVGILPRAHGSAMFQRGETQAVTLCTLGTGEDAQEFDSYTGGATEKKFILHYNFPNFSVGETGRISGPGRREIGHGALAERSLEPMVPLARPIPIPSASPARSWSPTAPPRWPPSAAAAWRCMDAGVPMTRPVAGISIGLCTEHDAPGQDHAATSC